MKVLLSLCLSALVGVLVDAAPAYTFTAIAGQPPLPGAVDGAGSDARFSFPKDVAVDASGNIYVSDTINNTIRKITPAGAVTTLAGLAGQAGSTDGVGSAARFNGPYGLTVDSGGNVYVAEFYSCTIRKIAPDGTVTTFAGTAGLTGSTNGTGSTARFYGPIALAIDSGGNLYVADRTNDLIRKITPARVVSTIAGLALNVGTADGAGSNARFNLPSGVAVDGAGNVYVADTHNSTIRKITPAGTVTTIAGLAGVTGTTNGVGSAARFYFPEAISIDASGNIFVPDLNNNNIRKVTPDGTVSLFAGNAFGLSGSVDGTGGSAFFSGPYGLEVDGSGNVYVADTASHSIRRITSAGVVSTVAGPGGGAGSADGLGGVARFNHPLGGITQDGAGNLFVVDTGNYTIRKITPDGRVSTFAGSAGLAGNVDASGSAARFGVPNGIAASTSGTLLVTDEYYNTIRSITSAGLVRTRAGSLSALAGSADGVANAATFNKPRFLATDSSGNAYIADDGNNAIRRLDATTLAVTTLAGLPGAGGSADGTGSSARFNQPIGIAVDPFGNIYASDYGNQTIRKITSAGVVTTLAGSVGLSGSADGIGSAARFTSPYGLAADALGNVFVADYGNSVIRKITPAGVVTTIGGLAGQSTLAFREGTGGNARFIRPAGVTVDAQGVLFIVDYSANVIVKGVLDTLPFITVQPQASSVGDGGVALSVGSTGGGLAYQWQFNGGNVSEASSAQLSLAGVQPTNAGVYSVVVNNSAGSVTSDGTIVGVVTTSKVVGAGSELQPVNIPHPNGNTFDQVLLTGAAEAITADAGQVTRTSFVDLNDDIVQIEFTGAGTLSLVLDNPTGPASPVNYNQAVSYMKGHAGIVVTGANETTNLSVFSVGRVNAFDPTGGFNFLQPISATNDPANNGSSLFAGRGSTPYDGVADIAFIAISSANGKFGGLRASNTSCFATKGLTGIYAPGVQFTGPVFIGDIAASSAATPVFVIGSSPDTRITGGDLLQTNGQPVKVAGLTQLKFTAGGTSHNAPLPALSNRAVLQQNGIDVTTQIVVNPTP